MKSKRKPKFNWTQEDHAMFVNALKSYGKNYDMITETLHPLTRQQIRMHATVTKYRLQNKSKTTTLDTDETQLLDILQSQCNKKH